MAMACAMGFAQREYVIVLHGGAGVLDDVVKDAEKSAKYRAALDSAITIGQATMEKTGEAIATVKSVINYLENNPLFNAGKGATVTSAGTFELDASIMDGKDLNAGAVAGVKHVKNPIDAAIAVKDKSPHVMLSGDGADHFAASQGLDTVPNEYFMTPKTMKWVEKFKAQSRKNGTVGCVVLDRNGNLAAGTSTGGMLGKSWGRIGDSPIIGAGTYADNEGCAVSCTGHGEYFIRHAVAYNMNARLKYLHQPIDEAANDILFKELSPDAGSGGIIAVDAQGNFTQAFNTSGMFRAYLYKEKGTGKVVKAVGIGKM